MRIAVVGSGISGLGAAWALSREHEVVLFEKQSRLGGHTHTHLVRQGGSEYQIDTGFIVYNPSNYPLLTRLLEQLGVASQPTTMGFSVQDARSGLEYSATSLGGMFCQRRNLVSPRFLRMVREILRFYRECPALLTLPNDGPTLGEYLAANGYSRMFIECHLVPMASALWSSPASGVLDFPARYVVRFMQNHQMLQVDDRPEWRVVTGGSSSYIRAMERDWKATVRLDNPVLSVRRLEDSVELASLHGTEQFDHVVLACHSDDALGLLADPSADERSILGAIRYQDNETVLHTDPSLLPINHRAWAAWNAYIPADPGDQCTVSYCMNLLQSIQSADPFIVTLNRTQAIDPERVIARMNYRHPLHTQQSVTAQERRQRINGVGRTWYAGAYWGFGFHEDGLRSGIEVARGLGAGW